jgi:hypothetical protein
MFSLAQLIKKGLQDDVMRYMPAILELDYLFQAYAFNILLSVDFEN